MDKPFCCIMCQTAITVEEYLINEKHCDFCITDLGPEDSFPTEKEE